MDQRNPARAAPQNRSFIVGEFAKSLNVVYIDAFASCGQHAALLPPGEQAAYGKQSRADHLRQLLARKVDLKRATPVDATPQLVKQAQQLTTQPCRHLFRGNLAVTLLAKVPKFVFLRIESNSDKLTRSGRENLPRVIFRQAVKARWPRGG
jgi:hypothetical protein